MSTDSRLDINFDILVRDVRNKEYVIAKKFVIFKTDKPTTSTRTTNGKVEFFDIAIDDRWILPISWEKYIGELNKSNDFSK